MQERNNKVLRLNRHLVEEEGQDQIILTHLLTHRMTEVEIWTILDGGTTEGVGTIRTLGEEEPPTEALVLPTEALVLRMEATTLLTFHRNKEE